MTSWEETIAEQIQHDQHHLKFGQIRLAHVDLSCQTCNGRGALTSGFFQNFWNWLADTFNAQTYTDRTIEHFGNYRKAVRLIADKRYRQEDYQEQTDQCYSELDQLVASIRTNPPLTCTVEEFQQVLIYVGTETRGFSLIYNVYQITQRAVSLIIKKKAAERINTANSKFSAVE